jgi:hypothetical protein
LQQQTNVTIVEYPINGSIYPYLKGLLSSFFDSEKTKDVRNEILVIFNPDYLLTNDTLQIHHFESDSLFINHKYDVLYASKACMYMIYEMITSNSFIEYTDTLKHNPIWKQLYKQNFIDYIKRFCSVKEFL